MCGIAVLAVKNVRVIVFQIILLFLWGQHRDKSSRRRALVEMLRWARSRSVCQSVILASTGCGVHTGCGGCRERMGCCVGSKGGIGEGAVGKMLKCSNQLVPRVERVGSHTLRRWLEHRREKYARGKGGVSVVKQQI